MALLPPQLPGLRLLHRLGGGLHCTVWAALDESRQPVVVKHVAAAADPCWRQALQREARNLRHCAGPGIVPSLGLGRNRDGTWLVMPRIDTPGLAQTLRAAPGPSAAHAILLSALQPIARLHARRWVHLDLKPEHVRVQSRDQAWLLDLGNARPLRQAVQGGHWPHTPSWCAPEQAAGLPLDTRTDVYALGRILEWALHARAWEVLRPPLQALAQTCMDPAPDRRPRDARVLGQGLQAIT